MGHTARNGRLAPPKGVARTALGPRPQTQNLMELRPADLGDGDCLDAGQMLPNPRIESGTGQIQCATTQQVTEFAALP